MVTKKQNSMKNLDSKIMDTIPLEQDFKDFYNLDYQYDQRAYTGEKPTSDLGVAVEKFVNDLESAGDRENLRKEQITDMRAYRELSGMDISKMSWDEVTRFNELSQQYPNLNIKKGGMQEDNAADLTDSSLDPNIKLHGEVLQSIEELQDLAAQQGMDISHEIKQIKIDLKTLMDAISNNPDIAEKGIKKGIRNYNIRKSQKSTQRKKSSNILKKSCAGGACTLYLQDGLKQLDCAANSEIKLFQNGTWKRR